MRDASRGDDGFEAGDNSCFALGPDDKRDTLFGRADHSGALAIVKGDLEKDRIKKGGNS